MNRIQAAVNAARRTLVRAAPLAAICVFSASALAHPGHEAADVGASLWAGLLHPLTGADHLLAMVAVGVWSALAMRDGGVLRLPAAFVTLMLVGAGLGMAGMTLPLVEPMIAASLLVLGLLIALRAQLPAGAGLLLVGGFALFHGHAHGAELPSEAAAMRAVLAYVGGFAASTAALHLAGIGAGSLLRRHAPWIARAAGAGVAAYGVGLMLA
ncbi:HupE/UreJ family protein [Cupriavidus sp. AU9028]|uniref:HupE/UreJ family protein n=1 Tax=Cupriavidus sp. AU9028 TaxID=2871157 RepID=UPI001C95A799|nr:HupE/UreJ family protein [Cupriavidus sp. AU9028]MBY4895781.1 HupE/UreJ family protein [Cupriavidus sp. AU9028]